MTDSHIRQAMRAGVLERLRHGTYVPSRGTPLSPEQRHTLLAYSVADKLGPAVALSHHSAALLHAGTMWGVDLGTIHLTRLDGRNGRTESGVAFHVGRVVPDQDICLINGRQVVVADRAVVESSSLATVESGMVTTSFALRAGACDVAELRERLLLCAHWPGMLHVRLALAKAEPRCESVGEVRSMYMFGAHEIPRPTVQYEVKSGDRVIARCDFGWEEFSHVGEFDGAIKYGRLNPYAGANLGQVIIDEKRREDAVRGQSLGMSRWMWDDLGVRAAYTAGRIMADLEQSRRVYRRNAQHII